ncbi:hypothetical protein [Pseudomonas sp. USHLN015]|uniref:hypothetical protein n=1 Tax=Pseudomonas sp. USHLN015 TaxID=3081296 RepID=UPI00301CCECB
MDSPAVYLHHNRGVKALKFTLRFDRAINFVSTKAFNGVAVDNVDGRTFLITKGLCQTVERLGRIKLVPYTGRFPRLALIWRRVLEVVRG